MSSYAFIYDSYSFTYGCDSLGMTRFCENHMILCITILHNLIGCWQPHLHVRDNHFSIGDKACGYNEMFAAHSSK